MIGDFDAYPGYDVQTQNNIGGTTHLVAPGAGFRNVILSAIFSTSAGSVTVTLSSGATKLTTLDIDAVDAVFDHNPHGWFLLGANQPLTLDNGCSSTIKYKVIPA